MKVIKGLPASSGRASGKAKIILSVEAFHKFKLGDILVTRDTNPEWTPLLALAKAVVTDTGGVLSHAAIISREYGIPAVVGTNNATEVLKDNDKIEVDGSEGLVRLIQS